MTPDYAYPQVEYSVLLDLLVPVLAVYAIIRGWAFVRRLLGGSY